MFRDGPFAHRKSLGWFRVAVLAAACIAIVLVASGISFWHTDAPGSEATCPICHVAHMPVLLGTVPGISTLSVVAAVAPVEIRLSHSAAVDLASPPRAPPA
jgi:hypothetical protein